MSFRRTESRSSRFVGAGRASIAALAAVAASIPCGCAETRGPDLVVNSHIDYNKAVSQVLKEELLLNVVRRRYLEAPQFLNVASISTNFSTSTSVGADASLLGTGDRNTLNTGVDAGVVFSDSPTITITPRQGEDIARQLHSPLSVSAVSDLVTAGYPPSEVLALLVEGINNLQGADLRYDRFRPGSDAWREAIGLIEMFDDRGGLLLDRFRWNEPYNDRGYPAASITPDMWITTLSTGARRWKSYDGGQTYLFTTHEMAPAVWMEPEARATPEGQRLMELLNVKPDVQKRVWGLEPARVTSGADLEERQDKRRPTLKLRMRSLYNVLNLYSYGVHVPPEDEVSGRATDLRSFREAVERGEMLDLSNILAIRFSPKRPGSAFLTVPYRGGWFFIDDGDLVSKSGFNALYDLWQLSIKSPASQSQPVTTIQVN